MTVTVTAYKESGKYYDEKKSDLTPEHEAMEGYQVAALILARDAEMAGYSPIRGGFTPEFVYVVRVEYPDNVAKFCNFMLRN